jgi:hypothetical protein
MKKEPDMGDNNNNNDNGNDNEGGSNDNNDLSFDSNNEEGLEEYKVYESDDLFLDKPKKNNMFQPNSNDILDSTEPTIKETIKNLFNSKKIVCLTKNVKITRNFNQEIMSEPIVEPKKQNLLQHLQLNQVEEIIHLQLNQILCHRYHLKLVMIHLTISYNG